MKKINDYNELSQLIMNHLKRGVAANYYVSRYEIISEISVGRVYAKDSEKSLFILRERPTHFSMYYYIEGDGKFDLTFLPDMTVVETAMREKDSALINADKSLAESGFKREFCRNRMTRQAGLSDEIIISPQIKTAGENDFEIARRLLHDNFSQITGCLPSADTLMSSIREGRVLLHSSGGLLHFEKNKTGYELRHLCTDKEKRGCGIGGELVRAYHAKIDKKSIVWVRDGYESAEKIYIKNGYARDGMCSSVLIYRKGDL